MRKIVRKAQPYNTLPLWQAARERHLRELPYAARRISQNLGVEPETARLVAELAGLKGGRD
jgi:hypothetical protein